MNRKIWIRGLILIGGLWALLNYFLFSNEVSKRTAVKSTEPEDVIQSITKTKGSVVEPKNIPVAHQTFETEFKVESEKIGQVDANPESTHNRLKNWAILLSKADLVKLKKMALNPQSPQDDRALSVYLLSLSNREESLSELGDIARNPIPDNPNPRIKEFELILRRQAVEGLVRPEQKALSVSELKNTIEHSAEPWIVDGSQRGLLSLEGQVEPIQTQDEKALEKLLKR